MATRPLVVEIEKQPLSAGPGVGVADGAADVA